MVSVEILSRAAVNSFFSLHLDYRMCRLSRVQFGTKEDLEQKMAELGAN